MKKINIGAGNLWKSKGWETLDNAPVDYNYNWQHFGKLWDTKLKSESYDIVFSSHTLEHISQFRVEKSIFEMNRILKIGGTLRILVPDLESSAKAYINKDKNFFKFSKHYNDSLGIGANFLRQIISPGGQTIAINREFEEILGGYAHLFCYDFEIIKTLLKKWGFKNIKKCSPGKSSIPEMQEFQHFVINGKKYDMAHPLVMKKKYLKDNYDFFQSGFDKKWNSQLVVEAIKLKNLDFSKTKKTALLEQARYNSFLDKIKIRLFFLISNLIDILYKLSKVMKMNFVIKKILFFIKK